MKLSLLLLLVTVFINIAGFSLILPLLPFYGHAYGASPLQVAMLFSAYSVGNVFGELYWGRLSDKIGRKPVMVGAIGCAALTYIAFAYASSLTMAVLIRIVSGFFSGTLGVAQGFIADITRPEDRAKNIGYFGAAFNFGFATGPVIGGLLAIPGAGRAGFHPPIFAAAALAGVAALWTWLALPAMKPALIRPLPRFGQALALVGASGLLIRLFAIAFFGIAAFASMEAVFGLWTEHNFGWTSHEVGLTFLAIGGGGMLVQVFAIGPLVRRFGEARVIVGGLFVLVASMVLQPILRLPMASVVLMAMLMMGHSLAFPNAGALVSRATPPDVQGSVMGLLMASNAFSRIVAPPVFALIYGVISPDAPYFACALMIGAVMIPAVQVVRLSVR
jgi:DHA1 family tetracycline resistance protein-like MFS transporter